MHLDIVEAIKQKQRTYQRSISIESGDEVDIGIVDGTVIVGLRPVEIVPLDD